MKIIVLLSTILFSLAPASSQAAIPGSRADVRKKLEAFTREAKQSKNVKEWLATTHLFSRLDREALQEIPNLPAEMPTIKRRFNDAELVITVDGITADFDKANKGEIILNGEKLFFEKRASLADVFAMINERLEKKNHVFRILPNWFSPQFAKAEAIKPTCLESKYEFSTRSPTALLESNFGYIGRLFVAGIAVSTIDVVTGLTANCDVHVADMKKILEENKIGLKSIDCGSDSSGRDRQLEFWVPETNDKGEYKTRTFDLDYTLLVAQEGHKDDEEDSKKAQSSEPKLYVFGSSELQEVRTRKINYQNNTYYCDNVTRGMDKFPEKEKDIEPFRKIFQYIGDYNSCRSCNSKLLLKLRTPLAPSYFPAPDPAKLDAAKRILIDDEDDEDDAPKKSKGKKAKAAPVIAKTKSTRAAASKPNSRKKSAQSSEPDETHTRSAR
jgi:DNA-directed RNA polymerase subunit RPC12/RpoP